MSVVAIAMVGHRERGGSVSISSVSSVPLRPTSNSSSSEKVRGCLISCTRLRCSLALLALLHDDCDDDVDICATEGAVVSSHPSSAMRAYGLVCGFWNLRG